MRTHGAEVHEEWDGNDPEVLGVDYVVTIELEEGPALNTCVSERIIEQGTDQKTIG